MGKKHAEHSFAMVIFGASGDLTKRKLMPALYDLYRNGRLPEKFCILGTGRTVYTDEEYRSYILTGLGEFIAQAGQDPQGMESFVGHLYYFPMDPSSAAHYQQLKLRLQQLTADEESDMLFYLATPPVLYGVIPLHLKEVGLNGEHTRIIVEKPFGTDLESARRLNEIYASVFGENQIYRIDHFLGKETAQNILALRFANEIFEPVWNRNYIDYVEITAVENLGIENRGGYYETSGALRDMVQNHLIQLAALIAMEPPTRFDADHFRNEVVKVYEALTPLTEKEMEKDVIRGQYTAGADTVAYRAEKNVDPQSKTETFVAMRVGFDNWRWSGVPFYIRTGKQMPTKVTEVVIHFKKIPHRMFRYTRGSHPVHNILILRIQPNEGIVLRFGMKAPGPGFDIKQVSMDFTYQSLGQQAVGDAYARLIEDCIQGDPTLFTRSDAVEASWKFFTPLLHYWEKNTNVPLYGYPAGTWGPPASEGIMHEHGAKWTNPCKNLTNTDQYCEL